MSANKYSLTILSQYIKDLSFENFNVINGGFPKKEPTFEVEVKVNVSPKVNQKYEVCLRLLVTAIDEEKKVYILEIDYAGEFLLPKLEKQLLDFVLMVDCPKLLFPFLRRIASDITRDGGYPPLSLQTIDFESFYKSQVTNF
jgi:preprotein translocase subunit SecB